MAALEEEETQIKGLLQIKYDFRRSSYPKMHHNQQQETQTTNSQRREDPTDPNESATSAGAEASNGKIQDDGHGKETNFHREIQQLWAAVPMRCNAIHVCYIQDDIKDFILNAAAKIGNVIFSRLRYHQGTFSGNNDKHGSQATASFSLLRRN